MSLRVSVFRAVLLSAALTCSATSRLRADNATSVYGAFAFADSAGAYVLTLAPLRHPERIQVLLAGSGRQFPVAYDGNQKRSGADTGRQTGSNFANSAGERFRILGGRVWGSETCFLATDSLVSVG